MHESKVTQSGLGDYSGAFTRHDSIIAVTMEMARKVCLIRGLFRHHAAYHTIARERRRASTLPAPLYAPLFRLAGFARPDDFAVNN